MNKGVKVIIIIVLLVAAAFIFYGQMKRKNMFGTGAPEPTEGGVMPIPGMMMTPAPTPAE